MLYFVHIAFGDNLSNYKINQVIDKIERMPHFFTSHPSAFIYTEDYTLKGLFNHLTDHLYEEDLEDLIVEIYNKPAFKNHPKDVEHILKELKNSK
jgi:hypothetical protein